MSARAPLLLLFVAASAFAQTGRVVTLDEALKTAEQNQPQLRQAQAQTEAARARANAAQSGLFPQVSGNVSYGLSSSARTGAGTEPSLGIGVNANQLIYDFGKTTS